MGALEKGSAAPGRQPILYQFGEVGIESPYQCPVCHGMGNRGTEILPLINGIKWDNDIMRYYGNISEIIFQSWDGNVYIYI